MRKMMACAAMLMAATPATAAVTLQTSGSELTGATGVSVGNAVYDVQFSEGTCAQVFGNCNASSFAFVTEASALTAAQALLDQVLTGAFDAMPARTLGCESATSCTIYIPYAVSGQSLLTAYAINFASSSGTDATNIATITRTTDTLTNASTVFARFTPAAIAAVPEPTTWAMMLLGFWGIGAAARRNRGKILAQIA